MVEYKIKGCLQLLVLSTRKMWDHLIASISLTDLLTYVIVLLTIELLL
jgi:hypothetical protein